MNTTSNKPIQPEPDATTVYWRTMWDVLLRVAVSAGHRRDPGESEFDFLQRIIRECRNEDHVAMKAYRRGSHLADDLE